MNTSIQIHDKNGIPIVLSLDTVAVHTNRTMIVETETQLNHIIFSGFIRDSQLFDQSVEKICNNNIKKLVVNAIHHRHWFWSLLQLLEQ